MLQFILQSTSIHQSLDMSQFINCSISETITILSPTLWQSTSIHQGKQFLAIHQLVTNRHQFLTCQFINLSRSQSLRFSDSFISLNLFCSSMHKQTKTSVHRWTISSMVQPGPKVSLSGIGAHMRKQSHMLHRDGDNGDSSWVSTKVIATTVYISTTMWWQRDREKQPCNWSWIQDWWDGSNLVKFDDKMQCSSKSHSFHHCANSHWLRRWNFEVRKLQNISVLPSHRSLFWTLLPWDVDHYKCLWTSHNNKWPRFNVQL